MPPQKKWARKRELPRHAQCDLRPPAAPWPVHERLLLSLPAAANLPVYITEMGIGGGTIMPGCGLIIRDALQYTYQLEEDPYVKGFHLWNVGSGAQWYDITSCLPDLADALIRYYTFKP